MTKYCVIMQGASGSGKTTIANILANVLTAVIHSTDNLRMVDGEYVFVAEESAEKHLLNQQLANDSMMTGVNVIIDNTNIKRWEAKPYVEMARRYGYVVRFVRCTGEYQNHHGVPIEKVQYMRNNMETLTVETCLAAEQPQRK